MVVPISVVKHLVDRRFTELALLIKLFLCDLLGINQQPAKQPRAGNHDNRNNKRFNPTLSTMPIVSLPINHPDDTITDRFVTRRHHKIEHERQESRHPDTHRRNRDRHVPRAVTETECPDKPRRDRNRDHHRTRPLMKYTKQRCKQHHPNNHRTINTATNSQRRNQSLKRGHQSAAHAWSWMETPDELRADERFLPRDQLIP